MVTAPGFNLSGKKIAWHSQSRGGYRYSSSDYYQDEFRKMFYCGVTSLVCQAASAWIENI